MVSVDIVSYTQNPSETIYRACFQCKHLCYKYNTDEEKLKPITEKDKVIRKVIENGHLSVLEHVSITFRIAGISRACSHQLVRHRLASYSQLSQRYVQQDDLVFITPKSINNNDVFGDKVLDIHNQIIALYKDMLLAGIPKEDARYILPEGTETQLIMTMNCRELLHFFEERLCNHAQEEIRNLAKAMLALSKQVIPVVFENAGPKCKRLGHCPETKPCGMVVM